MLGVAEPTDLKWTLRLPLNLQSPAINSEGTIYVTSSENKAGRLHGVRDEGTRGVEIRTAYTIDGSNPIALPAPVIGADDTVYFGPNTGSKYPGVFAMNRLLQFRWYAETTGRGGVGGGIAVDGDGVLYKVGDEFLAITPAGRVVEWSVRHRNSNEDCAPVIGPDQRVYFSPALKQYAQVDPRTGAILYTWFFDHEIHSSPAVGDDGLIYLCTLKQVFALNPTNHSRRLVYDPPDLKAVDFRGTAPVLGPDRMLYLGNGNRAFYVVDSQSGALRAAMDLEGTLNQPAAVAADGTVYFGTAAGVFYAVRLEGTAFAVAGRYARGTKIAGAPAIARDGTVYVTDDGGYLLAFRGTTGPAEVGWPMFQRDAQRTGRALPTGTVLLPRITRSAREPEDGPVEVGVPVTFTVEASGTGPLRYQWHWNGQAITSATGSTLTVRSVRATDAGEYGVVVSNSAGETRGAIALVVRSPGYVLFGNRLPELGIDARVFDSDCSTPLEGSGYTAELWAGTADQPLTAVPSSSRGFRTGANAGFIVSRVLEIPGSLAGQTVWVQVRVWDNGNGQVGTYEAALAAGRKVGSSVELAVRLGGDPNTPPNLLELQSFCLVGHPKAPEVQVRVEPNPPVSEGAVVTLCATAQGTPPFRYQWFKEGRLLEGKAGVCLVLPNVGVTDAGAYWVRVANSVGSAVSTKATVALVELPDRFEVRLLDRRLWFRGPTAPGPHVLEWSSGLDDWQPVPGVVFEGPVVEYHDPEAAAELRKFYRIRAP